MNLVEDFKRDFVPSVKKGFENYVNFSGRAARPEYWWFWLFCVAGLILLGAVTDLLESIFMLAVFLPWLAVGARRLHDIGKSGWWQLLSLIPIAGALVLIYFFAQPGQAGDNRFGPPPAGK